MRGAKGRHTEKHGFLRRVVWLCLVMMVFITLSVALLAWHSGEQLSSATVASLMGGWCGELLLSLLKRRFEREDRKNDDSEETEAFEEGQI